MYRLFLRHGRTALYSTVRVCIGIFVNGSIANLLDCIHACCRRRLVVVSLCENSLSQDDVRRCLVIYALAVLFCWRAGVL